MSVSNWTISLNDETTSYRLAPVTSSSTSATPFFTLTMPSVGTYLVDVLVAATDNVGSTLANSGGGRVTIWAISNGTTVQIAGVTIFNTSGNIGIPATAAGNVLTISVQGLIAKYTGVVYVYNTNQ
jgi:hypothetical protein